MLSVHSDFMSLWIFWFVDITSPTDVLSFFLICFCAFLRWERLRRPCFWQSWEELSRQDGKKLLIPGLLIYLNIWTMSYHVRIFMFFWKPWVTLWEEYQTRKCLHFVTWAKVRRRGLKSCSFVWIKTKEFGVWQLNWTRYNKYQNTH